MVTTTSRLCGVDRIALVLVASQRDLLALRTTCRLALACDHLAASAGRRSASLSRRGSSPALSRLLAEPGYRPRSRAPGDRGSADLLLPHAPQRRGDPQRVARHWIPGGNRPRVALHYWPRALPSSSGLRRRAVHPLWGGAEPAVTSGTHASRDARPARRISDQASLPEACHVFRAQCLYNVPAHL